MKLRVLCNLATVLVIALFSYSAANAQVVQKVKDAADKTKEVTVDTTKKTVELTKDAADKTKNVTEKVVDKTKDATVEAAKTTGSGAKKAGGYTVKLVDNVKGQSYEGGRWLVVTTWNGTKWVSNRTWVATKKAADATRDAIVGDKDKKP